MESYLLIINQILLFLNNKIETISIIKNNYIIYQYMPNQLLLKSAKLFPS
jgi:hypothetical protein